MKIKISIPGIVTVLMLGIIGPIIVAAYFEKKPDIKYFLNNSVQELKENGSLGGYIQELTIINDGNAEAKNIVVKIDARITNAKVQKYSLNDIEKIELGEHLAEILYQNLNPSGSFKVTFLSDSPNLESHLKITHSVGGAKDILKKSIFEYFYTHFILLYILGFVYMVVVFLNERFEFQAKYHSAEMIERARPIYSFPGRWNKIRKIALEHYFEKEYDVSLNNYELSLVYKTLNDSEVIEVSEEEKELFEKQAVKKFEKFLNSIFDYYVDEKKFEKIARISRPVKFPENLWDDFRGKLEKEYVSFVLGDLYLYSSGLIDVNNVKSRPEFINQDNWGKVTDALSLVIKNKHIKGLMYYFNGLDYVKNIDRKYIKNSDYNELENIAYQMQLTKLVNILNPIKAREFLDSDNVWLNDLDQVTFTDAAETIVSIEDKIRESDWVLGTLRVIVAGGELPNVKPEFVSKDMWEDLQSLYVNVVKTVKEAADQKVSLLDKRVGIVEASYLADNKIKLLITTLSKEVTNWSEFKSHFNAEEIEMLQKINRRS